MMCMGHQPAIHIKQGRPAKWPFVQSDRFRHVFPVQVDKRTVPIDETPCQCASQQYEGHCCARLLPAVSLDKTRVAAKASAALSDRRKYRMDSTYITVGIHRDTSYSADRKNRLLGKLHSMRAVSASPDFLMN
jgi:hypothetical protein